MFLNIFSSLNKEQKQATGILQLGTFLEYFDLMLYLHMAIFLNEMFLPKSDSALTNHIASALGFCSTYIFRPIGALIFGTIGDHFGRKITVVITTIMMSICCITIAITPTYAEIGSTATWIIISCRICQGLSSMGEVIGAQIYLTELIKIPERYPIVNLLGCSCVLGSLGALTVANFILTNNLDWRLAFWFGALIAIVGSIARTSLRETPEFVDAKLQLKRSFDKTNLNSNEILKQDLIVTQKVNNKTSLAYFIIQTARPIWFYFLYFYCAEILRNSFNYSPKQIIQHNLMLSYAEFTVMLVNTYLCYKINPLKIIKYRTAIFNVFIVIMPFLLINVTKVYHLLFIQLVVCMFQSTASPADAVFYMHFPVFKRFKYISFLYALSRALVNVITSLSIVYLTSIFNYWGLLIIFIPIMIGFHFAINYFIKLEEKNSKTNKLLNFNSAVFA